MGACTSAPPDIRFKLNFSSKELEALSRDDKVYFSHEELLYLHHRFTLLTGKKKFGGLNYIQLLKIFEIPDGPRQAFTIHFAKVFMDEKDTSVLVNQSEVGFVDFVHMYSKWSRGSLAERSSLLFNSFDVGNRGYLLQQDLVAILRSLFESYLNSPKLTLKPNSAEFKARMTLKSLPAADLERELKSYFAALSAQAIDEFSSDPEDIQVRKLYLDDFQQWVLTQKALLDFLTQPDDPDLWLASVEEAQTMDASSAKTLRLAKEVHKAVQANETLQRTRHTLRDHHEDDNHHQQQQQPQQQSEFLRRPSLPARPSQPALQNTPVRPAAMRPSFAVSPLQSAPSLSTAPLGQQQPPPTPQQHSAVPQQRPALQNSSAPLTQPMVPQSQQRVNFAQSGTSNSSRALALEPRQSHSVQPVHPSLQTSTLPSNRNSGTINQRIGAY